MRVHGGEVSGDCKIVVHTPEILAGHRAGGLRLAEIDSTLTGCMPLQMKWSGVLRFPILAVLLAPLLIAENAGATDGALNGRTWKAFNDTQKTIYFKGLEDGWGMILSRIWSEEPIGDEAAKALVKATIRVIKDLAVEKFTRGEIIQQLDTFYGDAANIRIPVAIAFKFAKDRLEGRDEVLIRKSISEARRSVEEAK